MYGTTHTHTHKHRFTWAHPFFHIFQTISDPNGFCSCSSCEVYVQDVDIKITLNLTYCAQTPNILAWLYLPLHGITEIHVDFIFFVFLFAHFSHSAQLEFVVVIFVVAFNACECVCACVCHCCVLCVSCLSWLHFCFIPSYQHSLRNDFTFGSTFHNILSF